jgi:peptidoglycan/xylan/chitin deacetylase (PgdA/CDA1 family)
MANHRVLAATSTSRAVTPQGETGDRPLGEVRDERERRAQARRRRRLRSQRIRRLALLCAVVALPALVVGGADRRPVKATIGGVGVWTWGNRSVAYATRKAGVKPPYGDLVDVRGNVLQPGGGECPVALVKGRPVSYGAPVRECRDVTFERGRDVREPLTAEATLVASAAGEEWRNSWKPEYLSGKTSVAGIERTERGALSGGPYLHDRSSAEPIAAGSAAPYRAKRLALTFDDGPNGDTTREILSILNAHGARATFFLLGDCVAGGQDIVREELAGGHEIGNHSWGHPQMSRLGPQGALANLARAERLIQEAGAPRCRWVRPPYGATNTAVRKAILQAGYNIALWSCDTNDWQRPGADTIYRRIIAGAKPGANILCHDGGGSREQTIAAVRRAVPELIAMGYELVTLSEMTAQVAADDAGMVLTNGSGTWEAHVPEEPVQVTVNGRDLSDAGPILVANGSVLVPAPAILQELGATWDWDTEGQTVTVTSLRGTFRFRLNSPLVAWDGREVRVDVPPMLYHDTPLIPAQALARAAGVRLEEQPSPRALAFIAVGN